VSDVSPETGDGSSSGGGTTAAVAAKKAFALRANQIRRAISLRL
jgi:hypothetical protein